MKLCIQPRSQHNWHDLIHRHFKAYKIWHLVVTGFEEALWARGRPLELWGYSVHPAEWGAALLGGD